MVADDVKPWLDMLVTLLTGGGVGGIILAMIGWMRAKHERPDHIAPSVGSTGMAQIGGMVLGQQAAADMIAGLNAMAQAQDRCTLVREQEIRLMREVSEQRHREMRTLNDNLDTLCDRIKGMPGCTG